MEFICGAVDFSSQQKFNLPNIFDRFEKIGYSDNHVIIYSFFDNATRTSITVSDSFTEIVMDDTSIYYTPESKTIDFTGGKSGLHRLFFTFVGSALLFSTNLSILVPSDNRPDIFFGSNAYSNITELRKGCYGSFSPQGLKFY